jgi:hypothetical protein
MKKIVYMLPDNSIKATTQADVLGFGVIPRIGERVTFYGLSYHKVLDIVYLISVSGITEICIKIGVAE